MNNPMVTGLRGSQLSRMHNDGEVKVALGSTGLSSPLCRTRSFPRGYPFTRTCPGTRRKIIVFTPVSPPPDGLADQFETPGQHPPLQTPRHIEYE